MSGTEGGAVAHLASRSPLPPEVESDGFGPLDLVALLVRFRWLVSGIMLAGLAVGLGLFHAQTPLYRATARIEVAAPAARVMDELAAVTQGADLRAIQTAVEKLKSRVVASDAVERLELAGNDAFLMPASRFNLPLPFRQTDPFPLDDLSPGERRDLAVLRIQQGLSVSVIRNTAIVSLSFDHADPELAQAVANQIAESFIATRLKDTSMASQSARRFIETQVAAAATTLRLSEEKLVAYAKAEGFAMADEGGSLVAQNISALNASLSEAMGQRLAAASLVKEIEAGEGERLREVLENPALLDMRARIVALRAEYRQKGRTFKPDFPDMRMLQAQIGEFERQANALSRALIASIRQRLREAETRETQLRDKLAALETEQATYLDKRIRYSMLKREVDANRAQHQALIDKLNQASVGASMTAPGASVLDPAPLPDVPIAPGLLRSLIASLLGAGLVASALVALLERLDNRFRRPDQIEKELGLPVLALLPSLPPQTLEAALSRHDSPLTEAYRSLRGALQFAAPGGLPRVILVTSAEPGEGKTTTALALARGLADLGRRVVLVDCDMRQPTLHLELRIGNELGLSNVLTNTAPRALVGELLHFALPNLAVMSAGPAAPNPSDLLSSARMRLLLRALGEAYDTVILDGPPVLGLADAPVLSSLAEGTLMVVSSNGVSRRAARAALQRLRQAGAVMLGSALSKVDLDSFEHRRAYGASGNYYAYGRTAGSGRDILLDHA
ncbi:MAG: polysaccharide biosynthesis tyrosine autokinase [Methylobacterium mesophilicum]|nr:polysaccharide biosynthesis tyrosine autokinase [Methylobacterium mesophilicum]